MPIARCLLQAIHYLHVNDYVHQDIHPGNVFTSFVKDEMVPNGNKAIQFKLADLGVAKLLKEVDAQNTRAQWMLPPEVLNSSEYGPIDWHIDIYHAGFCSFNLPIQKSYIFLAKRFWREGPEKWHLLFQSHTVLPLKRH